MKKVLISMMLVLLTLSLFVSCSSSPKVKEEPTPIILTIMDVKIPKSDTVTLNGPTLLKEITTIKFGEKDMSIGYGYDTFQIGVGGKSTFDLCTDSECKNPITDNNYRISGNITLYFSSDPT